MTKTEIIKAAASATGYTQETASAIIDAALTAAGAALLDREPVKIQNFGTLEIRKRAPRQSRNFKTGELMEVPEHNTITFKPAKELHAKLNGGGLHE